MAKSKAHSKLLSLLVDFKEGDRIPISQLCDHMGWKSNTLTTYESKQMLAPFISRSDKEHFKVLQNGDQITLKSIEKSFSQAKEKPLVLLAGEKLRGIREYVLEEKLGSGAVAQVWRARYQLKNGPIHCAIKVMDPRPDLLEPTVLQNVQQRFVRENRNGLKLNHPNIVRHLDAGVYGTHPFLVMELAENSAKSILELNGPMDLALVIETLHSCVLGLDHLHANDCIHRDVKPANILKMDRGFVLGDLGIVRWSDLNSAFTDAGTVTKSSVQLGSWFYMAPEQQQNAHKSVFESDIYALGVSAYELLTGRTPTPGEIGAKQYSPPSELEKLNNLVAGMIEYLPGNRPTLIEIGTALTDIRQEI